MLILEAPLVDPQMNGPADDERDAQRRTMALTEYEAFDAQLSVHFMCQMMRFCLIKKGTSFEQTANELQMDFETMTLM